MDAWLVILLAIIGAIPLTITSVASVMGARSSRNTLAQTKTNGGSSLKDDLVYLRSSMGALQGTVGILSDLVMNHVTDSVAHSQRTVSVREEAVRAAALVREAADVAAVDAAKAAVLLEAAADQAARKVAAAAEAVTPAP